MSKAKVSVLELIKDPKRGKELLTTDAVTAAGEACVIASRDVTVKAVAITAVVGLIIGGLVGYSIK